MSLISCGFFGSVALTLNSRCVTAGGYVNYLNAISCACVWLELQPLLLQGTYVSTIEVGSISVEKLPSHSSPLFCPCHAEVLMTTWFYSFFFFLFNSGIPTDTAQVTSLSQLNGFKMSPVPSTVLFSVRTGCALRLRLLSSHFCFLSEYRTVFFIFKSKYFFFKSIEFQNNFSLICKNYFEQTTCYFKMKLCWK